MQSSNLLLQDYVQKLEPPSISGIPNLEQLTDGTWRDYRKKLTPKYGKIWRDIGFYYLMLVVGFMVAWKSNLLLPGAWHWAMVLPIAIWIAFWLHAISSYMHEATHFLIHPDRRMNDKLADWIICSLMGQSVAKYRKTHWQHHLHLGRAGDTETTYRNSLSWAFVLTTISGWHVVRVLLLWKNVTPSQSSKDKSIVALAPLARFAVIQLTVLGMCFWGARWDIALAWVIGVFGLFPMAISIKNILEHQHTDSATTGQATNRHFGTSWLARHFGSAGFNRHLLHHWDPQISYTRFDDMETFLMQTRASVPLNQARTTYPATWRQLWQQRL